jgi:hypothetical protein
MGVSLLTKFLETGDNDTETSLAANRNYYRSSRQGVKGRAVKRRAAKRR